MLSLMSVEAVHVDRSRHALRVSKGELEARVHADRSKLIADQQKVIRDKQQVVEDLEEINAVREDMDNALMTMNEMLKGGGMGEPAAAKESSESPETTDETKISSSEMPEVSPSPSLQVDTKSVPSVSPSEPEASAISSSPSSEEEESAPSVASSTSYTEDSLREALKTFYGEKDPSKTEEDVDAIAKKYIGNVDSLNTQLKEKYEAGLSEPESYSFKRSNARILTSAEARTESRLKAFYKVHNPTKLGMVQEIVRRFGGDEDRLSATLRKKYGSGLKDQKSESSDEVLIEETESLEMLSKDDAKIRLLKIYAQHEPEKLQHVDSLLNMYEGRETELVHMVEKKYTEESVI